MVKLGSDPMSKSLPHSPSLKHKRVEELKPRTLENLFTKKKKLLHKWTSDWCTNRALIQSHTKKAPRLARDSENLSAWQTGADDFLTLKKELFLYKLSLFCLDFPYSDSPSITIYIEILSFLVCYFTSLIFLNI